MAGSKKYRGKQCAYCGVAGISRDAEHVIARSFFLDDDKVDLPIVPSCRKCNADKEKLEDYILMAFSLGSRHVDAQRFTETHFHRRAKKRQKLLDSIMQTARPVYERQANGLALPTYALTIDTPRVLRFFELVARGLYFHHRGVAMPADMRCDTFLFKDEDAARITEQTRQAFGWNAEGLNENIGRGNIRYAALISNEVEGLSFWIMSMMGGIVFGSDNIGLGFQNVHVFAVPEAMSIERPARFSAPSHSG